MIGADHKNRPPDYDYFYSGIGSPSFFSAAMTSSSLRLDNVVICASENFCSLMLWIN